MDETGPAADDVIQESLLPPAVEAAIYLPGLVPDPLAMTGFLTGVHASEWHAIRRDQLDAAARAASGPVRITLAACETLVRVTKYGVFDRAAYPARHGPCPACAWEVAITTGSTERELRLLSPDPRVSAAMAAHGVDPLLATKVCRAALKQAASPDAEFGTDHPGLVQVLAHVTAHAPELRVPEGCAEDDCPHRDEDPDGDGDAWRCSYPDASVTCPACSLHAGAWAGEWQGRIMDECRVSAPCAALRALAASFGVS